jgi:hypothetical protein
MIVMADEFTVGVEALERGDWLSACQAFEAALQQGQTERRSTDSAKRAGG